jgi:glucosyl-3-phosphoglycerate synthase
MIRTYDHAVFPPERIAAEKAESVSVVLPARNERATIGPILEALLPLVARGALDQVLVVDDSTDGTADVARALGAEVHEQSALRPERGRVLGKGDALWRSLTVVTGDVVCFLDADSEDLGPHFACGLVGPIVSEGPADFVKGTYRRPFRVGETQLPEGGGRVTELTARPLLRAFYPELAGFGQPLAGEFAGRRSLLERLPFVCGYGVDIALLIDAWREVGAERLAQADLGSRQNKHKRLADLAPMADDVLGAVTARLVREGRLAAEREPAPERPPAASEIGSSAG